MDIYDAFDNTSKTKNVINSLNTILSAFSTKGILQGLKAAGTSLAQGAGALIKTHPVITSLIAAYGALKLIDTFLFDADEKFINIEIRVDLSSTLICVFICKYT